jgi:hypothetical protein
MGKKCGIFVSLPLTTGAVLPGKNFDVLIKFLGKLSLKTKNPRLKKASV